MKSSYRFNLYLLGSLFLWFLLRDVLHDALFFEGEHARVFFLYINFALPNFLFFLFAGAGLRLVIAEKMWKWICIYMVVACAIQVVVRLVFSSSITYDWSGQMLLTMPYIGIVLGTLLGVLGAIGVLTSRRRVKGE